MDDVVVSVFRYKRTGIEFQKALAEHPDLQKCQLELDIYCQKELLTEVTELRRRSWLFLEPEHVQPVLLAIDANRVAPAGKQLHLADFRAWHVIAGPGYSKTVTDITSELPGRLQIKPRDGQELRVQVPCKVSPVCTVL